MWIILIVFNLAANKFSELSFSVFTNGLINGASQLSTVTYIYLIFMMMNYFIYLVAMTTGYISNLNLIKTLYRNIFYQILHSDLILVLDWYSIGYILNIFANNLFILENYVGIAMINMSNYFGILVISMFVIINQTKNVFLISFIMFFIYVINIQDMYVRCLKIILR